MSALALKTALRGRLVANDGVLALVPAESILDRHARPERFPCIVLGEGQVLYADDYESFATKAFLDLHVWAQEPGLSGVQAIADAIRKAMKPRPWNVAGHRVMGVTVTAARFLRDPSGDHAHAVLTLEAVLQELVE